MSFYEKFKGEGRGLDVEGTRPDTFPWSIASFQEIALSASCVIRGAKRAAVVEMGK